MELPPSVTIKSSELRDLLTDMETSLKTLQDYVGFETQTRINLALNRCLYLRDELWLIDKALNS